MIEGNVVGNVTNVNDVLRLGGDGSDSFDLADIGAAAQYRNFSVFEKTGTSTWTVTGTPSQVTNWSITDGTLAVNGTINGTVAVAAAGRLGGTGTVGTTTSAGTIAPGNSIGTLTINGDFAGTGGTLEVEAVLGGDASPTDLLVITGNTSGTTNVQVINLGGAGAQTVEGIKIVDVGGTSAGTFTLLGDTVIEGEPVVIAGAFGYTLQQNGISTPTDGDWYLRSSLLQSPDETLFQPGVPIYEAVPSVLLGFTGLPTFRQRVGERYRSDREVVVASLGGLEGLAVPAEQPFWARIEGRRGVIAPRNSTTGGRVETDQVKMQSGFDGLFYENRSGRLIGGPTAQFGTVSADIESDFGAGSVHSSAYSLGATLTWIGHDGFYVDGQTQATWFDSTLTSEDLGRELADGVGAFGYALSVEVGQRFDLGRNWSLTPQAQIGYAAVSYDEFTDPFDAEVAVGDSASLTGRLGLMPEYRHTWSAEDGQARHVGIYGLVNVSYELRDDGDVDVSGTTIVSSQDRLWGGIGAGATYGWSDQVTLYGEITASSSLSHVGDSYSYQGTAGLRMTW